MNIRIIIKLFSLAFCTLGCIFLNLDNTSWIHDALTIGLDAYILILVVCLISLAFRNELDYTLDYIFTLIGATLNLTGGIMAIVYYTDKYERYRFNMSSHYLFPIGICAILAGTCMLADLLKGIIKKLYRENDE